MSPPPETLHCSSQPQIYTKTHFRRQKTTHPTSPEFIINDQFNNFTPSNSLNFCINVYHTDSCPPTHQKHQLLLQLPTPPQMADVQDDADRLEAITLAIRQDNILALKEALTALFPQDQKQQQDDQQNIDNNNATTNNANTNPSDTTTTTTTTTPHATSLILLPNGFVQRSNIALSIAESMKQPDQVRRFWWDRDVSIHGELGLWHVERVESNKPYHQEAPDWWGGRLPTNWLFFGQNRVHDLHDSSTVTKWRSFVCDTNRKQYALHLSLLDIAWSCDNQEAAEIILDHLASVVEHFTL